MLFGSIIFLILVVYLTLDYRGPKKIVLRKDNAFGINCYRAKDLIVQEYDKSGNLWATRGMIIYQLKKGDDRFVRIAHLPTSFSFFWFNNFRLFRKLTLRSECVELTIGEDGSLCAFASGNIWNSTGIGQRFVNTMKMPYYGIGVGRGIMSTGLMKANDKDFFVGEYFSNKKRTSVRIYKYDNIHKQWKTTYEFAAGQIRHIHALQEDPYSNKLWVCTGDEDEEAMIGWSCDNYEHITPIGHGKQIWRACQLVFTEDFIMWGTDTGVQDLAGIYRYDKNSMDLIQLCKTDGAIFFGTRLANGTIVMSTDREGFPSEKDDRTRMFILGKDNKTIKILCGTWKYKRPGYRFNFAKLRFQRNQGDDSLVVSVLNQKEFPDGELLIFSEEALCKC